MEMDKISVATDGESIFIGHKTISGESIMFPRDATKEVLEAVAVYLSKRKGKEAVMVDTQMEGVPDAYALALDVTMVRKDGREMGTKDLLYLMLGGRLSK